MKSQLNIPHEERHQLVWERTPKPNKQQTAISETPLADLFSRSPVLSPSPDVRTNNGESSSEVKASKPKIPRTIGILAQLMVLDREGDLPLEDLAKPKHKAQRDGAMRCIRGRSVEDMAELLDLHRATWIKSIEDPNNEQVTTFSSADLPPVGHENLDYEARGEGPDTMISLAFKMAGFAREFLADSPKLTDDDEMDCFKFYRLFRSLGKAATQCSYMATYVRVSVWLFSAAADVCDGVGNQFEADHDLPPCEEILRKFLRTYVTLVLLGEGILMDGKIVED